MKIPTLLACVVSILLSGCAAPLVTQVTRNHRLPAKGLGQTFAVLTPKNLDQAEAAASANQIASHLEEYGWRRTDLISSQYTVGFVSNFSDGGKVLESLPADASNQAAMYSRLLMISAWDRGRQELFQIKSLSAGPLSRMSRALPAMIDASFAEFPGVPGLAKFVNRPLR